MKASLNHIFRAIWPDALNTWVAVSEISSAKGKRSKSCVLNAAALADNDSEASNLAKPNRRLRLISLPIQSATKPEFSLWEADSSGDDLAKPSRNELRSHKACISKSGSGIKPMTIALACCFSLGAQANPIGAQVVNGAVSINQSGNVLTVTNTPSAIINWQGFSIGGGETTNFVQQSASSSILNRVIGPDPSALMGTLTSNGRVFLINPAGILVGQGAKIDVGGLVASTLNLSNTDFLAGKLNFGSTLNAGTVQNNGTITTPEGGTVYLVAPQVENAGVVNTPKGETILAAGNTVQLIDTGTPGVSVQVTGSSNTATNLGQILADSGQIGVVGAVVRNSGTISANSLVSQGGKIFLKAANRVEAGGTITANGTTGGTIEVLGNEAGVMDGANVSVNGTQGGGTVLVGGDAHGANPNVQNAQVTYVAPTANISADGGVLAPSPSGGGLGWGNGGKVIVWADDTTRYFGNITSKGGVNGGDGGFVEVSGKDILSFNGMVNTSAPNGKTGVLLLDPTNVYIAVDQATATTAGMVNTDSSVDASGPTLFRASGTPTDSLLLTGTLQTALANNNVQVDTYNLSGAGQGNINVSSPITWTSARSLTLLANNNLNIANGVAVNGGGDVNLVAGWTNLGWAVTGGTGTIAFGTSIFSTTGNLYASAGNSITQSAGSVITANTLSITSDANGGLKLPGGVSLDGTNMVNTLAADLAIAGGGSLTFNNGKALAIGTGLYATGITAAGNTNPIKITTTAGGITANRSVTSAGTVSMTGAGGITLGTTGSLTTTSGAVNGLILDAGAGNFINSAGPTALSDTGGGRWLVYAASPANVTKGGLTSAFRHYSTTYANYPVAAELGNGFIYASTPGTLAVNTTLASGVASNTYGTAPTAVYGYTLSGTYDIEDMSGVPTFTPTISSTSPAGRYNITYAGGLTSCLTGCYSGPALITTGPPTAVNPLSYTFTPGTGLAYTVIPLPVNLAIALSGNKVYDGTPTFSTGQLNISNIVSGDVVSLSAGTANTADKNVGVNKPFVSFSGLALTGASAGNYTVTGVSGTGTITAAPLTLSTGNVTRIYDGGLTAAGTATVIGGTLFNGDTLSGGTFAFTDKNVGSGNKTVTTAGVTVGDGINNGNYNVSYVNNTTSTITVRPLSIWSGKGSNTLWSNPLNWDALPDGGNVLAVSIPAGSSVTYDGAAVPQTFSNAGNMALNGNNLSIGSYTQTGGSLTGTGNLTVTSNFSQTGGTITLTGAAIANITQATGNLSIANLSAPTVNLAANNGAITQTGPIIAAALTTLSATGTILTDVGNRISSFHASNSGSGNIALLNTASPLIITGINNDGGDIQVNNTGATSTDDKKVHASGAVSIITHSPLTIGSGGISAGGNIVLTAGATPNPGDNLTLNGAVSSSGAGATISLTAGDNLLQNANVSSNGGSITAIATTGGISMALGTSTSSGGGTINYSAAGDIILAVLNAGSNGAINLNAGGNVSAVPGSTGPNLIGGIATINVGGDANFSTQVKKLDATVGGHFTITDVSGVVFSDIAIAPELVQRLITTATASSSSSTGSSSGSTTVATGTGGGAIGGATGVSGGTGNEATIGGTNCTFAGGQCSDQNNNGDQNTNNNQGGGGSNQGNGATQHAKPASC